MLVYPTSSEVDNYGSAQTPIVGSQIEAFQGVNIFFQFSNQVDTLKWNKAKATPITLWFQV